MRTAIITGLIVGLVIGILLNLVPEIDRMIPDAINGFIIGGFAGAASAFTMRNGKPKPKD